MKLSEVFELNDDLKKCILLSGAKGLENEVSGIEVMEVPDGAFWVRENQIIITMGYSLKKNDITMASLIQMLIDRKACALGIKLGRFISEISQSDLDYAEKHNFPIFQIPLNLAYKQLLDPINRVLLNSQSYDHIYLKAVRHELSELLQEKCNSKVIINFLEKYLRKKVYLIRYTGFTPAIDENYNEDVHEIIEELKKNKEILFKNEGPVYIDGNKFSVYIEKIRMDGTFAAIICVRLPLGHMLTTTEQELICEVLPTFSAVLRSDMEFIFRGQKTPKKFFADVMTGKYVSQAFKITEEAAFLNIEIKKSRFCMAVSSDETIQYNSVIQALENAPSIKKTGIYYVPLGNKIAVMLETDLQCSNAQSIMDSVDIIYNRVCSILPDKNVKIAVSNICNSLKYLNCAYNEACFALGMGQRVNPDENIFLYEDYMVYRLLSEISNNFTVVRMYNGTFSALQKADEDSSQDYVNTVISLCENGFSIKDASAELFIHRNTLYKRIEKINDILGFDINKPDNRLLLSLLAKLHKMM